MTSAAGLLIGVGADRLFGDPRRLHPVAGFGQLAGALEKATYADSKRAGIFHVAALVGGVVVGAAMLERAAKPAWARTCLVALGTWSVLGGRSLEREARTISSQLQAGDLPAARIQVTHLVGRDTKELDAAEITRATCESVAENTADAVVAPLLWGAVAGLPGLLGYRVINTLDAMIGHRSARYSNFGWAAARLDDVANLLPARLGVLVIAGCAPMVGGSAKEAVRAALRDGPGHPSPNAGLVEAAFAGALGRTFGGVNVYDGHTENRGRLGTGPEPDVADISRTATLAAAVGVASAGLAAALSAVLATVLSASVAARKAR
ncbi:cobalamin biosynthesis protein [Nakamurella antarctica]|uniref:Cobalamin biosynthesis protein CobD n=1 Tax=Nakamurella antarctica TaxID=1902245 RepID=A0A3G8ZX25_9ACTN|nr:cobalamin biosynthesis protein [Nakamurella antarctica]AZI58994.1 cobalamin biosynthesis protein [Nakamurella antarctica]